MSPNRDRQSSDWERVHDEAVRVARILLDPPVRADDCMGKADFEGAARQGQSTL
jgi:hypothetical protein